MRPPSYPLPTPFLLSPARYIRNLFVLVVAYGMSINMVEVTWKSKLKQARLGLGVGVGFRGRARDP